MSPAQCLALSMAVYPTLPVCIQLTDYELESPLLGVAPIYSVMPTAPPPYNPTLCPPPYDMEGEPHANLPQYVALVGIHPMHQENVKLPNIEIPRQPASEAHEPKVVTKEVILNRKYGKFGLKTVVDRDNVIVSKVSRGSAAALAGLRPGDQLLKVNGTTVTGLSNDIVSEIIKRCPNFGVKFIFRTRKNSSTPKSLDNTQKTRWFVPPNAL